MKNMVLKMVLKRFICNVHWHLLNRSGYFMNTTRACSHGNLNYVTSHSFIVPSSLEVDPFSVQLDAILSSTSFNLSNNNHGLFLLRPMFRLFYNLSVLWEHAQISHGSQSINLKEKTMANLPNLKEKIKNSER